MKTLLDAIRSSSRITVKPSTVILRLPQDFPIVDLSGYGFYCSGEIFHDYIYLHCSMNGFLKCLVVQLGCDPLIVMQYVKQTRKTQN